MSLHQKLLLKGLSLVLGATALGVATGFATAPTPTVVAACEQDECEWGPWEDECEPNTGQSTCCDMTGSGQCTTKACDANGGCPAT